MRTMLSVQGGDNTDAARQESGSVCVSFGHVAILNISRDGCRNSDVLHQVFRYFDLAHWQHAEFKKDPSRTENARLRSLAASARVCTLFRDIALPVLWDSLSDPAPLLRLLSCTMTSTAAPNSRVFNLNTSFVPLQEMVRLLFYGSFVRRIEPRVGTHMCDPGSSIHTQVVDPASWAYLHALAFRLLSPLEFLERLVLYHHLASEVSALPSGDSPPGAMLPHLRELDISPAWRARNLCAIFQLLQSTELRRVMINTLDYMDVSSVREVCETTVACFPSLTSFKCHLSHPGEPGSDPLPIVPIRKAIAPLLAASTLVTVTISTSGMKLRNPQLSLTEEDFDAIGASWPRLQDLCLIGLTPEPTSDGATPPGVSISSLMALATHCPDLRRLELPSLDLRAHRLGSVHAYPFLNHTLRSFHCQDLLCDDYPFAARVLDRLFPRLDVIPQLVHLSRLARGTRTTAQTLSAFGGTLVSDYRLFLAIAVCQDGWYWPQRHCLDGLD
ncbi:hypothetical protein FKP32DRAFT_76289 [Trametes sanguinea]|nr:hypothetical protein FKP32DRAFT_76289 [Trametes sanguinea]